MANLSGIMEQLKKERERVERELSGLNAAIAAFVNVYAGSAKPKPKRKVSAKSRAKMAAAQRARWAKTTASDQENKVKPKRTMSVAARRKIAAFQRARWAKLKGGKKAA
jgi:hypothetical protein